MKKDAEEGEEGVVVAVMPSIGGADERASDCGGCGKMVVVEGTAGGGA